MAKVIYQRADERREVDVESGTSLMHGAIADGVDGIVGECGGNAMCATCHVYVREDKLGSLSPMEPDEDEMLQCTSSPRATNSRLSCQVVMTDFLDGLVVFIPEDQ